ncbi:hypothetical protein V2I01_41635 [Micromonospora sp. BRA006-A]|nr:hypothetical protein [Micromonospora sp. BRA006-A]
MRHHRPGSDPAAGGRPGRRADLTPIGWQYPEFAQWQHELMTRGELKPHQDYWTGQLTGLTRPTMPMRELDPQAPRLATSRPRRSTARRSTGCGCWPAPSGPRCSR